MITLTGISKSFGEQDVLREVSLQIAPGEHVGIVGPNGAGKSTIFSLITGEISADKGDISLPNGARIGYLEQQLPSLDTTDTLLEYAESGFPELADIQRHIDKLEKQLSDPTITGSDQERCLRQLGELQTRFESMDGYSVRNRAEAALSGLGFAETDFSRLFKEFSGGWQMRANLVQVLIANRDILLLDEPSNYLDIPAIEWLQRYLRDFTGTLILISHDRYLLNTLTSVTLETSNGRITRYPGNYDFYIEDRVRRHEQMLAAHKNQQRKREQTERFIERFRSKNTKAAAVQSRIKMLERMETIDVPRELKSRGRIRLPSPSRSGQEVIRLDKVGFSYDGTRQILKDIDLRVVRGEKVALVGLNGLGKTTLLRLLAGRLTPTNGKRVVGHKVQIGYQSQEFTETMRESNTVLDTVRDVSAGASEQEMRSLLGGFGFSGKDVDKTVGVLSGGERVRLAFARLLINPPNFLLLDEPTTHLDVATREILENALRDFDGTICFVSHDIQFVRRVAGVIIAMTPPGITGYCGGYDYYLDRLAEQQTAGTPTPVVVQSGQRKLERREKAQTIQNYSKTRRELQKEIAKIEKRIGQFEKEQAELLEELSRENVDYRDINQQLSAVQQKLNDYNMRWEAFAIELDELDQAHKQRNR